MRTRKAAESRQIAEDAVMVGISKARQLDFAKPRDVASFVVTELERHFRLGRISLPAKPTDPRE